MAWCGIVAVAMLTAPAPAQAATPAAIDAALARAETLARDGRAEDALAATAAAVALAERAGDAERHFRTLRAHTMLAIAHDQQSAPARLAKLADVASLAYGREGFQAVFARFKLAQWSYFNKAGGVTLDDLARAADAVVAPARTDEERTLAAVAVAVLANETSLTDVAAAQPLVARATALADTLANSSVERGSVYGYAATIALRSDRPHDAAALADRAIALYEIDQGARSANIVTALSTKATAARRMGDPGAADGLLRRTVAIVDSAPQIGPQFRARTLADYARFLSARGRHALALPMIDRAVAEARGLPASGTLAQSVVTGAARIAADAGRTGQAIDYFRQALAMPLSEGVRATTLVEFGRVQLAAGDVPGARVSADQALAAALAAAPAGHSTRGEARRLLAEVAAARGDPAAAALYDAAIVDLRGAGVVATARATAELQRAALLTAGGHAVDAATWRRSRAAADQLAAGLARTASDPRSEGAALALPAPLVDAALDVAWARRRALPLR